MERRLDGSASGLVRTDVDQPCALGQKQFVAGFHALLISCPDVRGTAYPGDALSPRSSGMRGYAHGRNHIARSPQRRRPAGRRRRRPRRTGHPQAADQGRREDDPGALAGRAARPPDGRRDHHHDGAGPPRRGADDRPRRAATTRSPTSSRAARPATTPRCEALERLGDDECNVLFHDAVRPLVTPRIIQECFEALATYPAVDVAIPSADTIIEVARRQHDPRRSRRAPPCAAARRRRRSASVGDQARPTTAPARTPTSSRPTTAPWCCATSRRRRSWWCTATSGT